MKKEETKMTKKRNGAKRQNYMVLIVAFCLTVVVLAALATAFFTSEEEKTADVKKEATQNETEDTAVVAEITSPYEIVINRSYPIKEGYVGGTGELTDIGGGFRLETATAEALAKMRKAMEKEGLSVTVKSAYRSEEDQEFLYQRQIQRQGGDTIKAATVSALPLTSEHQAGLAVDFTVDGNLSKDFGGTKQGKWLKTHCAEYGFILRYPQDKTEVTGIIWEPWHYRYVGSAKTAKAIMESGLTMEEYYGKTLKPEDIKNYLVYLK